MEQKVGNIIRQVLADKGMTKVEFARRLHTSNQNVHSIFRRSNFDTELLTKISEILDHDFFKYYQKKDEIIPATIIKKEDIQKARILFELELDPDEILKMGLKEKVLQIFK